MKKSYSPEGLINVSVAPSKKSNFFWGKQPKLLKIAMFLTNVTSSLPFLSLATADWVKKSPWP